MSPVVQRLSPTPHPPPHLVCGDSGGDGGGGVYTTLPSPPTPHKHWKSDPSFPAPLRPEPVVVMQLWRKQRDIAGYKALTLYTDSWGWIDCLCYEAVILDSRTLVPQWSVLSYLCQGDMLTKINNFPLRAGCSQPIRDSSQVMHVNQRTFGYTLNYSWCTVNILCFRYFATSSGIAILYNVHTSKFFFSRNQRHDAKKGECPPLEVRKPRGLTMHLPHAKPFSDKKMWVTPQVTQHMRQGCEGAKRYGIRIARIDVLIKDLVFCQPQFSRKSRKHDSLAKWCLWRWG